MKKNLLTGLLLFFVIILTACRNDNNKGNPGASDTKEESYSNSQEESGQTETENQVKTISAWTVYWDTDILGELEGLGTKLDTLCYFAAYFDENEEPFIPEETTNTFNLVKEQYGDSRYNSYLTFVNDLKKPDSTSSLKDTELLYNLLATEDSREKHINTILSMTLEGSYGGIEIDYEAIKEDDVLWGYFIEFVKQLYASAAEKNIPVRIVLEPNAPTETFSFPEGPEYVMMCYNLYGYGTEPGPKANKEFILEMIKKMQYVPGKKSFAFSVGGFDFKEDGTVEQITEKEALSRREEKITEPVRDNSSQSIYFTYKDSEGKTHQVWYADKETLDAWFRIVTEAGDYGLSLWRLGGNESLQYKK